jgi:anti-anti-sigma regulatory factor
MTLRIERDSSRGFTVLKLIGQIKSGDVEELSAQILPGDTQVVLDLDELALVDASVVRFLSASEESGVELANCPPYIREWIKREKEQK